MKKSVIATVAALVAAGSAFAEEATPEQELVEEVSRNPWTLLIGPSWRSSVKLSSHGRIQAPATTPRQTIADGRDMTDPSSWTNPTLKDNPNVAYDLENPKLWGVAGHHTEIMGVPGADYRLSSSDDESPIGVNLQVGYDLYQAETWAVGLNLRFAGYWNMNSATRGFYHAGGTYTQSYEDWYLFKDCEGNSTFAEDVAPYNKPEYDHSDVTDSYVDKGSHFVNTRLRTDLYQIGLGPKVTWSPFMGWCDWMDWLDVYGNVEVLCNLAHNEFDADGNSTTQTDCLIGFGGNVGLVGNVTDWLGVYGQVGYEWVDKSDVSTGGFSADIDYSSLVLSAGLQFRF